MWSCKAAEKGDFHELASFAIPSICIRIRSIGLLHLKKVRTLGRASPAEGQRFSVTGKGDISKLEKWAAIMGHL